MTKGSENDVKKPNEEAPKNPPPPIPSDEKQDDDYDHLFIDIGGEG